MKCNPNPFTPLQEKFLQEVRRKLIEIRDPNKDIEDNRSYGFYIEHTKTYGDIVKIRFRPNALAIKEEIMREVGYVPFAKKTTWKEARNAAASAFDKYWDNLIFRVTKSGRLLARINELFTNKNQSVSEVITLVQQCVMPTDNKISQEIPDSDQNTKKRQETSYEAELNSLIE